MGLGLSATDSEVRKNWVMDQRTIAFGLFMGFVDSNRISPALSFKALLVVCALLSQWALQTSHISSCTSAKLVIHHIFSVCYPEEKDSLTLCRSNRLCSSHSWKYYFNNVLRGSNPMNSGIYTEMYVNIAIPQVMAKTDLGNVYVYICTSFSLSHSLYSKNHCFIWKTLKPNHMDYDWRFVFLINYWEELLELERLMFSQHVHTESSVDSAVWECPPTPLLQPLPLLGSVTNVSSIALKRTCLLN